MFVEDFRRGFYDIFVGKHILILVNHDIDAICASKILQALFGYDNVIYTLVPVMGVASLQRAYEDNKKQVKYFILINCGGCIDIVDLLRPEEDAIFFILDSHRPLDVCNVYSDKQVCILRTGGDDEIIPAFDSIFRQTDDEDSVSENETNDLEELMHIEKGVNNRRELRKWEVVRDQLMFNYTQYCYYGRSSALVMFELAWKLSKDSTEMLWWAIVGITEQLIFGKIETSIYILEESNIQAHICRLNSQRTEHSSHSASNIVLEKDLFLTLYRHWSVYDSLRYSMYTACKLKLWTQRGEKKLRELLLEIGMPLNQAKQAFGSMDLVLRQEFQQMLDRSAVKYEIPDIVHSTFMSHYGYRYKLSASDYVYSAISLLAYSRDRNPEDCFLTTGDSLLRSNIEALKEGIEKGKTLLVAIFKQVQNALETDKVLVAGSYLYYIIPEENLRFSHPYGILLLGQFLLHGYVCTPRSRKTSNMPLVVCYLADSRKGLYLLVGITPIKDCSTKNFFGKAFEQAAVRSKSQILQDCFDRSIVQIRQADLNRFLDALSVLLD